MARKWDYGDFKLHPLWSITPRDADTEKITVGGEPLFRGTTSDFVDKEGIHPHPEAPARVGTPSASRIYLSEGSEDAEGYACIQKDSTGGDPLLCTIQVTKELFKLLRPGLEGLGEWYIDSRFIPKKTVKCKRLAKKKCQEYGENRL